jgi:NACalpha-BTF3-like transcription factor
MPKVTMIKFQFQKMVTFLSITPARKNEREREREREQHIEMTQDDDYHRKK